MTKARRAHFKHVSSPVELDELLLKLTGALSAAGSDKKRETGLHQLASRMFSEGNAQLGSPTLSVLQLIGSRWTPLILLVLASGTFRHSELLRVLNILSDGNGTSHISSHVLTIKLRELERDGMLDRKIWPEVPPRTDYTLTALGRALTERLSDVVGWSEANADGIRSARRDLDEA